MSLSANKVAYGCLHQVDALFPSWHSQAFALWVMDETEECVYRLDCFALMNCAYLDFMWTRAQLWMVITQPSTQGKKHPLCSLSAHGVTRFVFFKIYLLNNAVFYWNIIWYGLFTSTPWTGYKSWSIRSVIVSHLVGLAQMSRDNRRVTCGPAGVGLWMKGTSLQVLDWKNVGLQKQVRESTVHLLIPTNSTVLMIGKNTFKLHK